VLCCREQEPDGKFALARCIAESTEPDYYVESTYLYRLADAYQASQIADFKRWGLDYFVNSSIRLIAVTAKNPEQASKIALSKLNGE
jgi:hypothetical protein